MNDSAVNLFHQAADCRRRGDAKTAMKLVRSALQMDDSIPGAWYNFGSDLHNIGDRTSAIAALRRCLELTPDEPYALTNLGWNLQILGRHLEAAQVLVKAVDVAPDKALGWSNLSLSYASLRQGDLAIQCARKAVALAPTEAQHHMALSFALSLNGEYAEGLKEYEWRFQYKMPEFLNYPIPKWDGSPVEVLFIPVEQGFGDLLQFGRYIPLAVKRAKKVIVGLHEEVYPLLAPALKRLKCQVEQLPMAVPSEATAFCPEMSLPVALGLSDVEIPAVPAKWFSPKMFSPLLPATTRKKVGIVWAGSPEQDNDMNRSSTVQAFTGLYEAPGIQLYSLQVGDRAKECRELGPLIIDLSPKIRDFCDTASLMLQMDAVVSVCTSTAHLAGALGARTHVVLPRHGQHFVWEHGGDTTPWYPSMRLYRQERMGEWGPVISQVARAL